VAYHAGLEAERRERAQDAFLAGEAEVVVATVAFGMGIDKADVRYVVHRDMPRSVEGYCQEIGRAGRDGAPADCVLLYSWADVIASDRLCAGAPEDLSRAQRRQARAMFRLADEARCRHREMVAHFGERIGACGESCDLCSGEDLLAEAPAGPRPARPRRRRQR
jgi:ATP-dependent DNA helicase RecQ